MEIQVIYCYVAVDNTGDEKIIGVTRTEKTGPVTPLIAFSKEEAIEMEPAAKEIAKNAGICIRLKSFSSPKVLKDFKGYC